MHVQYTDVKGGLCNGSRGVIRSFVPKGDVDKDDDMMHHIRHLTTDQHLKEYMQSLLYTPTQANYRFRCTDPRAVRSHVYLPEFITSHTHIYIDMRIPFAPSCLLGHMYVYTCIAYTLTLTAEEYNYSVSRIRMGFI